MNSVLRVSAGCHMVQNAKICYCQFPIAGYPSRCHTKDKNDMKPFSASKSVLCNSRWMFKGPVGRGHSMQFSIYPRYIRIFYLAFQFICRTTCFPIAARLSLSNFVSLATNRTKAPCFKTCSFTFVIIELLYLSLVYFSVSFE